MCFSGCPYENREGECTLKYGNAIPEDAHCMDVDLIEYDVRNQYEWDKAIYKWENEQECIRGNQED